MQMIMKKVISSSLCRSLRVPPSSVSGRISSFLSSWFYFSFLSFLLPLSASQHCPYVVYFFPCHSIIYYTVPFYCSFHILILILNIFFLFPSPSPFASSSPHLRVLCHFPFPSPWSSLSFFTLLTPPPRNLSFPSHTLPISSYFQILNH